MWEGIRYLEKRTTVNFAQKDNVITLSCRYKDPGKASDLVASMLTELNDYMSGEVKRVADTNRKYLEAQVEKTSDPFIKAKIYTLIAQHIETSAMAEAKENFTFKVLDPPRVPDKRISPEDDDGADHVRGIAVRGNFRCVPDRVRGEDGQEGGRVESMRGVVVRKADGQAFEKGRINANYRTGEYYMKRYSKVATIGLVGVLLLIAVGTAYPQVGGGAPASGVYGTGGPLVPQAITIPEQAGRVTPGPEAEAMQQMTPAQRIAVEAELGMTRGQLTPQATEALKARPEFQNLSPEEIAKGKGLLEKKEKGAEKKEPEKRESTAPEKTMIREEPKTTSLFDRYKSNRQIPSNLDGLETLWLCVL